MNENQIEKVVSMPLLPPVQQWELIQNIASKISRANGMSEDKMANILLLGFSVGLSIPASLELVQNVQGKTSLAPRGAWALVQNSPVIKKAFLTRLVDAKNVFLGYECTIERQNGFSFTGRWTLEQANKAGLVKPGSAWEHYPENMTMWRAIGFACDVAASDVTCGLTAFMKMPEKYNAEIDSGGNVIVIENLAQSTPDPLPAMIEKLCDEYGAAAVLSAGGGEIPSTIEKCAEVEATIRQALAMEKEAEMEEKAEAEMRRLKLNEHR